MNQRRTEPLLGDDDARTGFVEARRIHVRHEPKKKRAKIDRAIHVVRLREIVVVENDLGFGSEQLLRVVTEGRRCVSILHEMPGGPREREAADEPRGLRHAIHAIARLRCERQNQFARPELASHELNLE